MNLNELIVRKNFINQYRDWFLCLFITILGAALRIYHYDTLPPEFWTSDEYAFAWSGMSLIQDGIPTSWSWLSPTDDFPIVVWEEKNIRFRMATPWFDHPPLFGLLIGMTAILGGATNFFDCQLSTIRIPSLILGIISICLLYIIALRLFGTAVAIISSLIFATNPNTVFLSRLAISENLLLLISLVVILFILEYHHKQKPIFLYSAAVLSSLAILVKVTGFFLVLFLFLWLIYQKKWRESLIVVAIGLLGLSLYYLYGWIYDFELFQKIIEEQTDRFTDFGILKYLVLPTVFFEDGWLIFGWLALFSMLNSSLPDFKRKIIILPPLIYALLLVITGAQSHFFAWYMIPFYPFLFLALGVFFNNFRKQPSFIMGGFIFLFLGIWSINTNNLTGWMFTSPHGRTYFISVTAFIMLTFLLDEITKGMTRKLTYIISILAFLALMIGNINLVLNYRI